MQPNHSICGSYLDQPSPGPPLMEGLNPNIDGSYRPFSAKVRLNSALFIHQEGGILNNELVLTDMHKL